MRIAITYKDGDVFQHFGHSSHFKIYNVLNKEILSSSVVSTNGEGHGKLATFLMENKVDILICGGIGQGAKNALQACGIHLFCGVKGNCEDVMKDFMNGELKHNPNTVCAHHDHHEGAHSCTSHCHEH